MLDVSMQNRIKHNCIIGKDMYCTDCGYPIVNCSGVCEHKSEGTFKQITDKFYCSNAKCVNHTEVELPSGEKPAYLM